MNNNFNIEKFLSLDGYATDERVKRRKANKNLEISNTNEYFTPYSLIQKMLSNISEDVWSDVSSDFLEPSAGHGNFVIYIVYNKIMHGSTWEQALLHTWCLDIVESNILEIYERILNLFKQMDVLFNKNRAMEIMRHNFVCSDFFKWNFDLWCPYENPKCNSLF